MTGCPSDETLSGYLDASLGGGVNDELEDHIADCARCQSRLESLIDTAPPVTGQTQAVSAWTSELEQRLAAAVATGVGHVEPRGLRPDQSDAEDTLLTHGEQFDSHGSSNASTDDTTGVHDDSERADWSASHGQSAALPLVPNHLVHEQIGRGGMGRVYRATQLDLNRVVALKTLSIRSQADRAIFRRRFSREAQLTARLDHPSIVPVYLLGETDGGTCWYTMRFVRGHELKQIIRMAREQSAGWNLTRTVSVFVQVAQAVAFAHGHGVVHRDLKPSNVMVGNLGEVYVMDWGLAQQSGRNESAAPDSRRLGSDAPEHRGGTDTGSGTDQKATDSAEVRRSATDDTIELTGSRTDAPRMTMDGSVVGTPAYMSPEQAAGRISDIDPRSDIYSLGAMLYQLLSGRAPFDVDRGRPLSEVLDEIIRHPPEPLSKIVPSAPPELVAICERAMAQDPQSRYASALELAADLQAYLELRVVRAYQTGALAEARKWITRNRTVAVLSLLMASAVLIGLGGVSWQQKSVNVRLADANAQITDALNREKDTSQKLTDANATLELANEQLAALQQQEHVARVAATQARAAAEKAADSEKVARLDAQKLLAESCLNFAEHAASEDRWGHAVLWYLEAARLRVEDDPQAAAVHRMRAVQHLQNVSIPLTAWWDEEGLNRRGWFDWPMGRKFQVTPDGRYVAQFERKEHPVAIVDVWNTRLLGDRFWNGGILSFDGTLAAVQPNAGVLEIRRLADESVQTTIELPAEAASAQQVCFSTDNRLLAVGDKSLVIYDVAGQKLLQGVYPVPPGTIGIGFSQDGTKLAAWNTRANHGLRVFDVLDEPGQREPVVHEGSPLDSNGEPKDIDGHRFHLAGVRDVQPLAPDGRNIHDIHPRTFGRHGSGPSCSEFTADSEFVGSVSGAGVIRLWRTPRPEPWYVIPCGRSQWTRPALTHDSRFIAPVGFDIHTDGDNGKQEFSTLHVRHLATGERAGPDMDTGAAIIGGEFSPDDSLLVLLCGPLERSKQTMFQSDVAGNELQFWDWRKGERVGASVRLPSEPRWIDFNPGQPHCMAVACGAGHVLEVDVRTRESKLLLHNARESVSVRTLPGDFTSNRVEYNHDGSRLFEFGGNGKATVIDTATGRSLHTLNTKTWFTRILDTGSQLVIGAVVHHPRLHSVIRNAQQPQQETLRRVREIPLMRGEIRLSPDRRLVLGAGTGATAVSVWNLETGSPAGPPIEYSGAAALFGDFIPGTPYILVGNCRQPEQWLQVYDWQTGRAVTPRIDLPLVNTLFDLRISADARTAAIAAGHAGVIVLDLSSLLEDAYPELNLDDLRLLAELSAGSKIENARVVRLDETEWAPRWKKFTAKHPDVTRTRFRDLNLEQQLRHHKLQLWRSDLAAETESPAATFHRQRLQQLLPAESAP